MQNKIIFSTAIAIAGIGLFQTNAYALSLKYDDEVVVTAAQTVLPRVAVGSAITVITSEDIEKRGTTLVSDLLREVPGLAVSQNGTKGTLTQIRIRGAESNHTVVLIDGVEVIDPGGFSAEYNFGNLTTANIERIEVLRGAQSALWGSEAIGGVINIITKKAASGFNIQSDLEIGSQASKKVYLAADYANEFIQLRLSSQVNRSNGTNIARTGSEEDGFHNRTYDANLKITPTENLVIDFNARHVDSEVETDPESSGIVVDNINTTNNDQMFLNAKVSLDLFEGFWRQEFASQSARTFSESFSPTFTFNSIGKRESFSYKSNFNYRLPLLDSGHSTSFFLEYEDEKGQGSFLGRGTEVGFVTKSYAFEHNVNFSDKAFITAGFRHDNSTFFDNADTFRITGAYIYEKTNTRPHFSFGTAVKNPTITELFGNFPTFTGNSNLTPEKSKGWDFGIEQSLFDDSLIVDITYFRNLIKDQITGSNNTVRNQDGTNSIYGLETSLTAKFKYGLSLSGSYTYTNTKDSSGTELVRRAKNIASLNINYSFLNDKANINLGVLFNGSQRDTPFLGGTRTPVNLPSYTLINLNGNYRFDNNLQLYGRVENLLDKEYEEIFSYRGPELGVFAGIRYQY